jgi:hypothetical protein
MARFDATTELPAHTPGTPKGEERIRHEGFEPGRQAKYPHRLARDSTSINPKDRRPIDPRMPEMPPP